MGQWIVDSFQKIFGLRRLEGSIVEKRKAVTLVCGRRTECDNIARILEREFAIDDN